MLLVSIVQASDWTLLPIWLETKATWKQSAAVGATGQRMQRAEVQSSPSGPSYGQGPGIDQEISGVGDEPSRKLPLRGSTPWPFPRAWL